MLVHEHQSVSFLFCDHILSCIVAYVTRLHKTSMSTKYPCKVMSSSIFEGFFFGNFFKNAYRKLTILYRRSNYIDVIFDSMLTIFLMKLHMSSLEISLHNWSWKYLKHWIYKEWRITLLFLGSCYHTLLNPSAPIIYGQLVDSLASIVWLSLFEQGQLNLQETLGVFIHKLSTSHFRGLAGRLMPRPFTKLCWKES